MAAKTGLREITKCFVDAEQMALRAPIQIKVPIDAMAIIIDWMATKSKR